MFYQESLKPIIGTFLLCLYLPVPVYLLWLHGLHPLWRRLGVSAYLFLLPLYFGVVFAIVRLHPFWCWRAWPWPGPVSLAAVIPLGAAGWLAYLTYKTIDAGTLHLVHQIRPNKRRTLIRSGILGRVRHPRYLMFSLIALGNLLVTGYPLVFGALVATVIMFWGVIRLEERELLSYFGEAYADYRRSVPAFLPRWKRR